MEEYCEHYLRGNARKVNCLELDTILCKEKCPYGNQREIDFIGKEYSICTSNGIKKLKPLPKPGKIKISGMNKTIRQLGITENELARNLRKGITVDQMKQRIIEPYMENIA